mmetsp:Transcript_33104/g.83200  ORF Transcript_33104/g.83200 Transcript_33104/m.83200 type:complete len:184 (-) Transcript_33104:82-633(-)
MFNEPQNSWSTPVSWCRISIYTGTNNDGGVLKNKSPLTFYKCDYNHVDEAGLKEILINRKVVLAEGGDIFWNGRVDDVRNGQGVNGLNQNQADYGSFTGTVFGRAPAQNIIGYAKEIAKEQGKPTWAEWACFYAFDTNREQCAGTATVTLDIGGGNPAAPIGNNNFAQLAFSNVIVNSGSCSS